MEGAGQCKIGMMEALGIFEHLRASSTHKSLGNLDAKSV